ncbi:putative RNA-directed DNA polymerase, eukaryota, reverse transcriptase zinc-binding domain protein, partial [Tanacetum coccineum]
FQNIINNSAPTNIQAIERKKKKQNTKGKKLRVGGLSSLSLQHVSQRSHVDLVDDSEMTKNIGEKLGFLFDSSPKGLETKIESLNDSLIRYLWPNNYTSFVANEWVQWGAPSGGYPMDDVGTRRVFSRGVSVIVIIIRLGVNSFPVEALISSHNIMSLDHPLEILMWLDIKRNSIWRHFNQWEADSFSDFIARRGLFDFPSVWFKECDHNRPSFRNPLFRRISSDDAFFLETAFSLEEVKAVVWDCAGSKATGPDGFNFNFIKTFWELIKVDFWNCIQHFESTGEFANGCNPSFIVLIPKKPDPIGFSDYRPISLIGCVYKVISKLLASRLASVIGSIIGLNQSAFINGRQILDGCLIANEIIRMARMEDHKLLLFKVDFEKAFDSVNWNFLISIMRQMGFGEKWRNWIASCLSSSSISVLINGSPSKEFKMERGLRQGDPLSPFLFLLVADALQVITVDACNKCIFKGVFIGDNGANVSLLQFADDALFFGEWSSLNASNLIRILKCFEMSSSLKVNLEKSRLFGVGIPTSDIESVVASLGCACDQLPFIYLGLPVGKKCAILMDGMLLLTDLESVYLLGRLNPCQLISLKLLSPLRPLTPTLKVLSFEKFQVGFIPPFGMIHGVDWRLAPRGRATDDLTSLISHMGNISLSPSGCVKWVWTYDPSGLFKVRSLSKVIQNLSLNSFGLGVHHSWNSWIPRKGNSHRLCELPALWLEDEDVNHILISCSRVLPVWMKVWSWWSLDPPVSFPPFSNDDVACGNLPDIGDASLAKVLQGVFQIALLVLWNWRNRVVYAPLDMSDKIKAEDVFPSIQRLSLLWISARFSSKKNANWNCWTSKPFELFCNSV